MPQMQRKIQPTRRFASEGPTKEVKYIQIFEHSLRKFDRVIEGDGSNG